MSSTQGWLIVVIGAVIALAVVGPLVWGAVDHRSALERATDEADAATARVDGLERAFHIRPPH